MGINCVCIDIGSNSNFNHNCTESGEKKSKVWCVWIFYGILFIAALLIFFFGLSSEFPSWVSELFWDIYSFQFAFYGSFIAGAFAILAGIV